MRVGITNTTSLLYLRTKIHKNCGFMCQKLFPLLCPISTHLYISENRFHIRTASWTTPTLPHNDLINE